MKLISYLRQFTRITAVLAFFIFTVSCASDSGDTVYEPDTSQTDDATLPGNPDSDDSDSVDLTSDDQQALYFMLEEEKLARDVYTYLGELWTSPIFENITQSETKHIAAVETLLISYGLEYEILDPGTFEDSHLQELYDSLTDMGSKDLEAALWVGATIEDLDIQDLQEFIDATKTDAIKAVFESLQCGSRNHLRAFNRNLENLGATYIPQFISTEQYEVIINSSQEQCN